MKNAGEIWQQIDTAVCRLMFLEAAVGMTFAEAAINAYSTDECLHNRKMARRAYDTAQTWMHRGRLTDVETKDLRAKLLCLGEILRRLGDPHGGESKAQFAERSGLDNRSQL